MYTLQTFGSNTGWNLTPSDTPILPSDIVIHILEPNRIVGSIPKFDADFITEGIFYYPEDITSFDQLSGLMYRNTFSIGNQVLSIESWSGGSELNLDHNYQLTLLSGDDVFIGSPDARIDEDGMQLLDGNDRFKGYDDGEYGDKFFGGNGLDTSIYQGKLNEYIIYFGEIWDSRLNDGSFIRGIVVEDLVTNRDGTDDLVDIERLEFEQADSNGINRIAFDTGANENAGNAYLLYQAAFDRTPDAAGLGYWITQMDNGANAVRDMAMNFILSDEFISLYGPNPTVPEFMNLLYENVLNRPNDAAGLNYWLSEFARDGDTLMKRAATLNNFAISAENVANVADQIDTGILYQAYVG